jgi:hypothetical protein
MKKGCTNLWGTKQKKKTKKVLKIDRKSIYISGNM